LQAKRCTIKVISCLSCCATDPKKDFAHFYRIIQNSPGKEEHFTEIGKVHCCTIEATEEMAACNAVAGVPHVYGTPSLVTLIERTAHETVADSLSEGQTTVGCTIDLNHSSPTPIGMKVECRATLVKQEGIMLYFEVEALDEAGRICECKHSRAIVEKARIEAKAAKKIR